MPYRLDQETAPKTAVAAAATAARTVCRKRRLVRLLSVVFSGTWGISKTNETIFSRFGMYYTREEFITFMRNSSEANNSSLHFIVKG
jgi:hypothetical protein